MTKIVAPTSRISVRLLAGAFVASTIALGAFTGSANAEERHWDHGHYWHHGYYRAPPVVYGGGYYAPPPVVYGAPGFGLNINIR
jgi:hypothetical protein